MKSDIVLLNKCNLLFSDGTNIRSNWPWPSRSSNFQPLESMPEISKPLLSETLSMPLLNNNLEPNIEPIIEIGSGDEERLLPTDLLIDSENESESETECYKPILRKTASWTPPINAEIVKKKPELSTLRHLERAIKSLSIDPNVSISRKF